MLSEINQAEKDKCYIISDIYIYICIYIIYIWNVLQNGDRTDWWLQEVSVDTEKYLKFFFILNK